MEKRASQRRAKVVLITGCSSGIGLASARRFAQRGHTVYATMRAPERGQALQAEASALGWRLFVRKLDVTNEAEVAAVVSEIEADNARGIDVLVNNAGRYLYGPVELTQPSEVRAAMETNLIGPLNLIRAVLPGMRERGHGTIVNVSSLNGVNALPVVGAYQMSKFALEALTEQLRYEVGVFGIRVACIEPGTFATELHSNEVQTEQSAGDAGPYGRVIGDYRRVLARQKRAPVEVAARAIYKASVSLRPKLRWPVGPLSVMGGVFRPLVPDAIYELAVRLQFRLRAGPRRGRRILE